MEKQNDYSGEVKYLPIRVLDQEYYYVDVSVTHKNGALNADQNDLFTKKSSFLMVLDRSGSMCGGPWKALTEGATQVATRIYEQKEFEHFSTMFFNHQCVVMPTDNLVDFNSKISQVQPKSKTDFVVTFKKIVAYCEKQTPEDLTVLFLTDGNDTCNDPEKVTAELENLKTFLNKNEITSRFFTIGLSSEHDAVLLSNIATAGSDLGNFFYVDYSEENETTNYKTVIKECLIKTFDMGIPGNSLTASIMFGETTKRLPLSPVEKEEEKESDNSEKEPSSDLVYQGTIILESLPEGQLELQLLAQEHSFFIEPEKLENPDISQILNTEIGIINKVFFDLIQKVVNGSFLSADESKKIYEKIGVLDQRVSEMIEQGFKIKNRIMRKAVIKSCQNFKDKCHTVIATLREVILSNKTIDLAKIAKLNDLAYKAIRSKGLKKKLDERALRNEEHYKNLNSQIQKRVKEFDFNVLGEKYSDIINLIGDCPLTCLNALEAMQEGDCLGICLDVARSEAAIADPNQLVVKDVVPTFMSCSAYLDSAAYNLERASDAHGTFDKSTQGSLATGIGRENVTGILPLYLFKEHWEIAKRTVPSIFGFMCTLDIMGYSEDQFYIIPFTVLFKCYDKVAKSDSELNNKILSVVKETCIEIIKRHPPFAQKIVDKLKAFQAEPISRTKDCIPNFKVFWAQVLCCIEAGVIDKTDGLNWNKILRFAIEEDTRRLIGKSTEVPSKKQQCNILNNKKTDQIVAEAMKIKGLDENKQLTQDEIIATLRGQSAGGDGLEEAKVKGLIDDEVNDMPWLESIKDDNHPITKQIQAFDSSVQKKLSWVKTLITQLNIDSLKVPEKMSDLEFFSDPLIVYAMLFQNFLHTSNKLRRETIESGKYFEIESKNDAKKYLMDIYRD